MYIVIHVNSSLLNEGSDECQIETAISLFRSLVITSGRRDHLPHTSWSRPSNVCKDIPLLSTVNLLMARPICSRKTRRLIQSEIVFIVIYFHSSISHFKVLYSTTYLRLYYQRHQSLLCIGWQSVRFNPIFLNFEPPNSIKSVTFFWKLSWLFGSFFCLIWF